VIRMPLIELDALWLAVQSIDMRAGTDHLLASVVRGLERWRTEGIGPKFLKLLGRVIYRVVDIEALEESCLSTSTRTLRLRSESTEIT